MPNQQTRFARVQPPHLKNAAWDSDIVIDIGSLGACFVLGIVCGITLIALCR